MDPNEALAQLLEMARIVIATSEDEQALRVAEGVLGLHEWISKGGFLPMAWQPLPDAVATDPGRSGL